MEGGVEGVGKAPRSEVDASLRDLHSGSNDLPWTSIIFYGISASGQRDVIIGRGVVFSKDANGCSGRGVRKHGIAVRRVNKRLGVGGVIERASVIGRAIRGVSGVGTRVGGIGNGVVTGKRRQLTRQCRARASAQPPRAKIFRRGGVNGLVVTNTFRSSMNIRTSDFAVWHADWRYDACWIARRGIANVVGACVASE